MRQVQALFTIAPFHVKSHPPRILDKVLQGIEIEWRLYEVRLEQDAPRIFVLDDKQLLAPGQLETALEPLSLDEIKSTLASLPEKSLQALLTILNRDWGFRKEESQDLATQLLKSPYLYKVVPRLRDLSILENLDWKDLVGRLACPKPGKDPVLVSIHTAKILKPLSMQYAPHSFEVTNSGTGKSIFYKVIGLLIDKLTSRTTLGFAKSPKEVYPGTIHRTDLPTAFDQIESQASREIGRYMLNAMEYGEAIIDSGAIRFPIRTNSTFAYLGNPVSKNSKAVEGFRALLDHITSNPAIGRRFGIILFEARLKAIKGDEKLGLEEQEEWKRRVYLFRAVEEYARPKLRLLIKHPKVEDWLRLPIPHYRETISRAIEGLDDENVVGFFEAHIEATHRVRGAALHAAVALLLDKIALDKAGPDEILGEAEELLNEYVRINLNGLSTLARMWDELRADQAKAFFENLSGYMKEVVSAVIIYRQRNPDAVKVKLKEIPYEPEDKKAYPYFSKCIDLLKRKKKLEGLNQSFKDLFGFQLEMFDEPEVLYFEGRKPPEDLKPIGNFVISSFSSFRRDIREGSSQEEAKNGEKEKGGESE